MAQLVVERILEVGVHPVEDLSETLATFERCSQMLSDDHTRSLQHASSGLSLPEARHALFISLSCW